MARTACLVCFISTVNGHCNKKRKKKKLILGSSRHTTNLKQSILRLSISMSLPDEVLQRRHRWLQTPGLKLRRRCLMFHRGQRTWILEMIFENEKHLSI